MALEEGAFDDRGIELRWSDVPEGTGRMCDLLRQGKTDLAIVLTEGVVKAISEGLPAGIVQGYIASPLLWGVHVAAGSAYHAADDLRGRIAAISRYGSGSHLMAYVNAANRGWITSALEFNVVGTLDAAVEALEGGLADYFLWERFTTQPLVDRGIFRRLDICPTPWPCFVVACNRDFYQSQPGLVKHVLDIVNRYTQEFRDIPSIDRTLANRYGQQVEAIREWLQVTGWSQEQISENVIDLVADTLLNLNLLKKSIPTAEIVMP